MIEFALAVLLVLTVVGLAADGIRWKRFEDRMFASEVRARAEATPDEESPLPPMSRTQKRALLEKAARERARQKRETSK